jgi:hypothetical protein
MGIFVITSVFGTTYSLLNVPSIMQQSIIDSHFTPQHSGCYVYKMLKPIKIFALS